MRTKSYGSVKVLEPEPAKVEQALQSLVQELCLKEQVCAVWLIGSYHRKNFGPFSDVDLVLIVENSEDRFLDRSPKFAGSRSGVPMDIFVYTVAEIRQMRESGHPFWKHIEENHTSLFERQLIESGRQKVEGRKSQVASQLFRFNFRL